MNSENTTGFSRSESRSEFFRKKKIVLSDVVALKPELNQFIYPAFRQSWENLG